MVIIEGVRSATRRYMAHRYRRMYTFRLTSNINCRAEVVGLHSSDAFQKRLSRTLGSTLFSMERL